MIETKKHLTACEVSPLLGKRIKVIAKNSNQDKKGTIVAVRLTESGQYKKPLYIQFDSVAGQTSATDFDLTEVKILQAANTFGYITASGEIVRLGLEIDEVACNERGFKRASQFDESNEV